MKETFKVIHIQIPIFKEITVRVSGYVHLEARSNRLSSVLRLVDSGYHINLKKDPQTIERQCLPQP